MSQDLLDQIELEFSAKKAPPKAPPNSTPKIVGALALLVLFGIYLVAVPADGGLDFGWRQDLVGVIPPEVPVVGVIQGDTFEVVDSLVRSDSKSLTFFSEDGRKVVIKFVCTDIPGCPQQQSLAFTNQVGFAKPQRGRGHPPVIELWNDEEGPPVTVSKRYTLVLKAKSDGAGGSRGGVYLCLEDEDQGFLGGQFHATPPGVTPEE